MSLLFADIYDGIRAIRITKGACEKDILNFVQEKVGGCMNVGNVLKTIRTLKKLCDDGVLIKKGNRYIFSQNKGNYGDEEKKDENEENGEEEKGEGDENPEENEANNEDCLNEADEEEDEDEDEDEEDDEDDDDDDDEDDDDEDDDEDEDSDKNNECQKNMQEGGSGNPSQAEGDKRNDNFSNRDTEKNNKANIEKESTVSKQECEKKDSNERLGSRATKEQMLVNGGDGKDRGDETIAFCVRDFIDSLSGPNNEEGRREKGDRIRPKERLSGTTIGKALQAKKRACRRLKRKDSHEIFRSRSPIERGQIQLQGSLKWNQYDDNGLGNDFGPVDVEMDIDDLETVKESSELQQNVDGPFPLSPLSSLKPPGKVDSCCSDHEDKILNCVKKEVSREKMKNAQNDIMQMQDMECYQMTWYPLEEKEKQEEIFEKTFSSDDEQCLDKRELSLCSICDKKKRNS